MDMSRLVKFRKIGSLALPFTTIFFSSWMGMIQLPGLGYMSPDYGFCTLFFWSIYRPDLIPLGFLFLMGLIIDVLSGKILGQTSLVWFVVYWLAISQRRILIKANFMMVWSAFSFVFFGYEGLSWAAMSLIEKRIIPIFPSFSHFLLTIGIYPFITSLLIILRRSFSIRVSKEI